MSIRCPGRLLNRPFPSFPGPLYQNKVKCSAFDMKWFLILMQNKTLFSQEMGTDGIDWWIDLATVFDATLMSRQMHEKLQCLYENPKSNNFRKTAALEKIWTVLKKTKATQQRILPTNFGGLLLCLNFSRSLL